MELSTVLTAILKASAPKLAAKAKKSERVVSVLATLRIDTSRMPEDFDQMYTVALVTYGMDKPRQILDFFRDTYLRQAFERAFETGNATILEREADELFARLAEDGALAGFDYDPRRELESFTAVFWSLLERSRSPQEVSVDRQLRAILAESESARDDIARVSASIASVAHLIEQSAARSNQLSEPVSKAKLRTLLVVSPAAPESSTELARELMVRGFDAQIDMPTAGGVIEHAPDILVALIDEGATQATLSTIEQMRSANVPAFIYIVPGERSDPSFNAFLQRNVINSPTTAFNKTLSGAGTFAPTAAADISAWLTREYRMLTARSKSTLSPGRQHSRTFEAASRIQGFAAFRLEQGTSLDLLYEDVTSWFRALDFRIEDHHVSSERHAELIVNVPARRRFDRVLVRVVSGELISADVESLADDVVSNGCDEGWAVAASRVSPAALATAASSDLVECYTLDELIDQDADFEKYLQWLEEEITLKKITERYIPLDCQKREPGIEASYSVYDDSNGGTEGYLDRWIADPSKEHVSVLGEFGTGKTWLTLHYAWTIAQRYKEAKRAGTTRPRLPIIIPLRDYAKAVSVESLFSEFLFRKHDMGIRSYRAFDELNRMGKLLLIFDGFDEMAARIDRQAMIDNFWQLASVVVPGSKAILTCRSEHFPSEGEGRDLLAAKLEASVRVQGTPPQFDVLELRTLSDSKIRKLLEQRSDAKTADLVLQNPDLRELARRPIMSELILDALPEIEAGRDLGLTRIYKYAIRRKMIRDIRDERTFTSLSDKLFFLCELSWEMFVSSRMSVNYREFPETIVRCFGARVARTNDLDHWRYDMLGQTILIRDANGDYAPAHRSFLEFFAAYRVCAHLGIMHDDYLDMMDVERLPDAPLKTWSEFFFDEDFVGRDLSQFTREPDPARLVEAIGGAPWSVATVQMIREMTDPTLNVPDLVIDLLRDLRGLEIELGFLPDNLARIALQDDRSAFRGRNLDDISLRHAVLDYRELREPVTLAGASLRRGDLSGCDLEKVDFSDSDCSGADFSNARYFPREPLGLSALEWANAGRLIGVDRRGQLVLFDYSDGFLAQLDVEDDHPGMATAGINVAGDCFGVMQALEDSDELTVAAWDVESGRLVGHCPVPRGVGAWSLLVGGRTAVFAIRPKSSEDGVASTVLRGYSLLSREKIWEYIYDDDVRDIAPGLTDATMRAITTEGVLMELEVDATELRVLSARDVGVSVATSLGVSDGRRGDEDRQFDRLIGNGVWTALSSDANLVVIESDPAHRALTFLAGHFSTVSAAERGRVIASLSAERDDIAVHIDWGEEPDSLISGIGSLERGSEVTALAVSPDGSCVAVATADCMVRVVTTKGDELASTSLSRFYIGANFSGASGISEDTAAELRRRGAVV